MRKVGLSGLLAAVVFSAAAGPVRADDNVWVTGHVGGTDGRPIAGARVAVYDDSNKVIDYATTDKNGDYAMTVPKRALHLDKKGKSFFTQVVGGALRFAGQAAGFVANPLRAGVHEVASTVADTVVDPVTKGGIAAGSVVADQVLFAVTPRGPKPPTREERKQPGALLMKVVTDGKNDMVGVAKVYWVQEEILKAAGKEDRSLMAWIDPVQMTPAQEEKPSEVRSEYLHFKTARLTPSLASPGQKIRVEATLPIPPDPPVYVVVVARNNRTGQKWELKPTGAGRYEAEILIDKKFPRDDQTISILAYAAEQQRPGRRPDAERAIEGAGLWDVKKFYRYDPLLVVSRNRADLTLTVVIPDKKGH